MRGTIENNVEPRFEAGLKQHYKERKILLVEDDSSLELIFKRILKSVDKGVKIDWAENIDEAFVLLGRSPQVNPYELVVCDIYLPNLRFGFEVLEYCKKILPQTPFAFMSGMPTEEYLRFFSKQKICPAFISKPLNVRDTSNAIETLLSR